MCIRYHSTLLILKWTVQSKKSPKGDFQRIAICEDERTRDGTTFNLAADNPPRLSNIAAASPSLQKHIWFVHIILLSGDGMGTSAIMTLTGKLKTCVWRWHERYMHEGVGDLIHDKPRPPGKAPILRALAADFLRLTQGPPQGKATHRSVLAMAKAVGITASTVQAIWKA